MAMDGGNLREAVRIWYAEQKDDGYEGALSDLLEHGCQSGMVSGLIYYSETGAFYQKHRAEIAEMLAELIEALGVDGPAGLFGDKWDASDPLALEMGNQNLLAWFGFEEEARRLYDEGDQDDEEE